jgi:hypothetical protein
MPGLHLARGTVNLAEAGLAAAVQVQDWQLSVNKMTPRMRCLSPADNSAGFLRYSVLCPLGGPIP